MAYRLAACVLGSFLVLLGACDHQAAEPHTGVLTASTTQMAPLPTTTTTAPLSARKRASTPVEPAPATTTMTSTTATATQTSTTASATTTTTTTTTTTVPAVTQRQYPMYERSPDVVQLQMVLDLRSVDGIYGPVTRAAHVGYLGGPVAALSVFYPEFTDLATEEVLPLPTLDELVRRHFRRSDRPWALRAAFCESSADPGDVSSVKVSSALALGWFQHLAKFWTERSATAGWAGHHPFHGEANVAVAAWLFYEGGGTRHWNPSRTCWETE